LVLPSVVLLALTVAGTAQARDCPRPHQIDLSIRYRALLTQYRGGDRAAAIEAAARWPQHDVDEAIKAIFANRVCKDVPFWSLAEMRAAALLEGDVAQAHIEPQRFDEMKRHFAIARVFLRRQDDPAFTQRWYVAFARRLRVTGLVSPWELEFLVIARIDAPDAPDVLYESGVAAEFAAAGASAMEVSTVRLHVPPVEVRRQFYRQRLDESLQWLRQSISLRDASLPRVHLARVLIALGQSPEAATILTGVIDKDPASRLSYVARLLLGGIDHSDGRPDAALRVYDDAIARVPSAQSARLAASALLFGQGRAAEARQRLSDLSRMSDDDRSDDPWSEYLYERGEDVREALDALRREVAK
jgi:tetratricopeptide (TPR) repeat protein